MYRGTVRSDDRVKPVRAWACAQGAQGRPAAYGDCFLALGRSKAGVQASHGGCGKEKSHTNYGNIATYRFDNTRSPCRGCCGAATGRRSARTAGAGARTAGWWVVAGAGAVHAGCHEAAGVAAGGGVVAGVGVAAHLVGVAG